MRVGCEKGKGTAVAILLETEEALLDGADDIIAVEDIEEEALEDAAEEVTGDNTLDTVEETGIL